jgi:hypothetical protein
VRSTAPVNQFYVYAVDRDFGPFFLKFCSNYSPLLAYSSPFAREGHLDSNVTVRSFPPSPRF